MRRMIRRALLCVRGILRPRGAPGYSRNVSDRPLWQPSPEQVAAASLTAFMRRAEAEAGAPLRDYAALHRWSVEAPEKFWPLVWSFCGVVGDGPGPARGERWGEMPGTRWFPEARLNFAENLLRRRDATAALLFRGEHGGERGLPWADLQDAVARFASALRASGVGPGDRVAAVLPNAPETVVAALAAASIGAIWSSCSPDFGAAGVLDRFGQIEPKLLLVADGYAYGGKR